MPAEKFANDAQSPLTAAVAAGDASLSVASAAAFPSSGNFRLLIDSEILLVTAVAGNTFTVSRGQEGTAAAAHANGAYVTHVLTAAALTGHFASLETANTYLALNAFGPNLITSPFGTGTKNEAFGASAGNAGASSGNNTLLGNGAGAALTTGGSNTAVGQGALSACTTGANNNAFGVQALQHCTSGGGNMAFGLNALENLTTGSNNTCVGQSAGKAVVTDGDTAAVGFEALLGSVAGGGAGQNTAVGSQAMGAGNVASGATANVAVGRRSFYLVTTGANNVVVGANAAQSNLTSGSQNTLLGANADTGSAALNYTVGLGYKAVPTASNECALSPYLNLLTLHGLSSTNTDRPVAEIDWAFATSTDASRKGQLTLGAHDFASGVGSPREGVRVESDGAQALVGFYGVAATARQLLATGAGHTVDDVITALQNLGLVKQS